MIKKGFYIREGKNNEFCHAVGFASMQTGNYQAIDKKVVYEFIIMTSNLTGIAVEKLVEPSYTAWTLQREQWV